MKIKFLTLTALMFAAAHSFGACPDPLPASTLCVEWEAPTQNVDNTPLDDLAGFEIWAGLAPIDLATPPGPRDPCPPGASGAQCFNIPNPVDDTFTWGSSALQISAPPGGGVVSVYVAMTAYDTSGNTSTLSNTVVKELVFADEQVPASPRVITVLISVSGG